MANYTMKYGDLIDAGIITRADLPKAWAGFPSLVLPIEGEIDFYDVMYRRYANREIGGDTPAVFLRFLNEETLNVLEMLPDGLYSHVLADMVADANEETRTIGGQDTNNITRSASGSNTHTGANKQTTTGTTSNNQTIVVDGEGTRDAETKDAITTHTGSVADRAAPNGVVSEAYITGGRTENSTDTTNAKESVTTTEDSTTTTTGGSSNNNTVNDTIDEKGTSTESGTETATRDHNTTENVTRKGAASGNIDRAYAILRDGKPLVMWIADRYNSCFMGVY